MAYVASSLAVRSLNTDCISQHNGHLSPYSALKLPRQKFHGNLQDKIRFLLPSKIPANSFIGQIGYPLRKKASLVVSAGWSLGDQNIDSPNERPPYDSYRDSNTGDLVPARGARPSIPDKDFWSEDTMRTKPGQAPLVSSKSVSTSKPSYGKNPGSRRKKSRGHAAIPETSAGETGDDKFTPEPSNYSSEEEVEETSTAQVIQEPKTDEEIFAAYELARKYGEPHSFVPPTKKKTSPPLLNEELWWNWRKAPKGMERWTEWKKITPSSEAAMAMAMAETGQIKIFGEKPTVAEASLARARKRALKNERLSNEEERKKELGPMAYYQEWVKAWKKDTSKEAVQKHFEETGEDVHTQLANMFQHQTDREYCIMVGTDLRILRDPLTMRMRPEHKRAVFGGDPVYPTINYEQDPNHTVDYRGPNFHEPLRDALDHIRQSGRLISQDELEKMLAKEMEEEENENDLLDEAMAVAVDIGEKDDVDEGEDENQKDDDESEDEIQEDADEGEDENQEDEDESEDEIQEDEDEGEDENQEDEDEGEDEIQEDKIPYSKGAGSHHSSSFTSQSIARNNRAHAGNAPTRVRNAQQTALLFLGHFRHMSRDSWHFGGVLDSFWTCFLFQKQFLAESGISCMLGFSSFT